MLKWVNKEHKDLNTSLADRPALKPLNSGDQAGIKKIVKPPRVKFNSDQKEYLNQCFAENPRPNQEQRFEISQKLEVDPKIIVIWFCNKRARENQLNQTV